MSILVTNVPIVVTIVTVAIIVTVVTVVIVVTVVYFGPDLTFFLSCNCCNC